jgi:Uma2 family endonuclease
MKSMPIVEYGTIQLMSRLTEHRQLIPGSTGWSVHDLDDPRVEAEWEAGNFQIIEGVLALMPPAYFQTNEALLRLIFQLQVYLKARGEPAGFACEVDVVVGEMRVPKADAVYMTPSDKAKQLRAKNQKAPKPLKFGRLSVPPTLVIENISKGHESEDRVVKRRYYAEAAIPNYWILDVYEKSLECLVLRRGKYALDQLGRGKAILNPKCFARLSIDLAKVWED